VVETAAAIDERFEQALAAIRARRRLSDEDCTARKGSSLPEKPIDRAA
jgi:hypothetical protein